MTNRPIQLLLIEDNMADATLLSALLKQVAEFSFDFKHCKDLASGVDEIRETQVDVVILDLGLPDSFGIATYETLREQFEQLPIIIITGNDDRDLLAECMTNGADNYLIKDAFDGNRVAVAVLAAMRNRTSVAD